VGYQHANARDVAGKYAEAAVIADARRTYLSRKDRATTFERRTLFNAVILGLVPRICQRVSVPVDVADARDEPEHDENGDALRFAKSDASASRHMSTVI
jgi:hypothetical protein